MYIVRCERIYVGAYVVGVSGFLCVREDHLSPSNGLGDLWLM